MEHTVVDPGSTVTSGSSQPDTTATGVIKAENKSGFHYKLIQVDIKTNS